MSTADKLHRRFSLVRFFEVLQQKPVTSHCSVTPSATDRYLCRLEALGEKFSMPEIMGPSKKSAKTRQTHSAPGSVGTITYRSTAN
ncbi:hypothetical protein Y1Q_0004854 [Alligator mississippiensis]|uniref:Uncharacterized protein n=1 Tax=Alligator mississippiensis TaxID=8496 RepID=A0A151NR63_ALLMI|nr:hypothetical protein Y1Q_0004854 [Alligator mississippiensis]